MPKRAASSKQISSLANRLGAKSVASKADLKAVINKKTLSKKHSPLSTEELVPTQELTPTQELVPTQELMPTQELVPTQELGPSTQQKSKDSAATGLDVFEEPPWPTQDLPAPTAEPATEVVPPSEDLPTQDLAGAPKSLEDWVKLGAAVKSRTPGSSTAKAPSAQDLLARAPAEAATMRPPTKKTTFLQRRLADGGKLPTAAKSIAKKPQGFQFDVPASVLGQVYARSAKKSRREPGQGQQSMQHSALEAHGRQEPEPTQELSPQGLEVEPTQELSPQRPQSTQSLEPSQSIESTQELIPSQDAPWARNLEPRPNIRRGDVRVSSFERPSVPLAWNPVLGHYGAVRASPVKRSFTDLVRQGLAKREYVMKKMQPPDTHAAEAKAAGSPQEAKPPSTNLEDGTVGSSPPKALSDQSSSPKPLADAVEEQTPKQGKVQSPAQSSPPAGATPPGSAMVDSLVPAGLNTPANTSRRLSTATDASAALNSIMGADSSDRKGGSSALRDDAGLLSTPSPSKSDVGAVTKALSENLANLPDGQDPEALVRGMLRHFGASPGGAMSPDGSPAAVAPEDPMMAIMQERAAQGAQRVLAAQDLARMLAERQKAVAKVYEAMQAMI